MTTPIANRLEEIYNEVLQRQKEQHGVIRLEVVKEWLRELQKLSK